MRKTLPPAPRVNVDVTGDIIDTSIPRDSGHCMVADAVKAAVPDAAYISADIQTIRFTDLAKGLRYTYLTARVVQQALIDYDQGLKPEPFRFQLRNGQVTRAGGRKAHREHAEPEPRTEAQQEVTEKAMQASPQPFGPAKLAREHAQGQGQVPSIRGGRVPPVATLAGGPGVGSSVPRSRRRAFGLRAMDR